MTITFQNQAIEQDFMKIVKQNFDNNVELALNYFIQIYKPQKKRRGTIKDKNEVAIRELMQARGWTYERAKNLLSISANFDANAEKEFVEIRNKMNQWRENE